MAESSRSTWTVFAGGIILGSAAAAGAAYAATSYYINKQEQQLANERTTQAQKARYDWARQGTIEVSRSSITLFLSCRSVSPTRRARPVRVRTTPAVNQQQQQQDQRRQQVSTRSAVQRLFM